MKMIFKEVAYFEVEVPDGTDRAIVTDVFHKHVSPNWRLLLEEIVIDEDDLRVLRKTFGSNVSITVHSKPPFK